MLCRGVWGAGAARSGAVLQRRLPSVAPLTRLASSASKPSKARTPKSPPVGRVAKAASPPARQKRTKEVAKEEEDDEEDDEDDLDAEIDMANLDPDLQAAARMLGVDAAKHEAEYARFRKRVMVAEDHVETGRFAEAIKEYEEIARSFAPNFYFSEMYIGLGCAFVGLGQHAHAVTVFDKALTYDADHVDCLMNKGLAQVASDDNEGALISFEKAAAAAHESNEPEHFAQAMVYAGQLLEDMDNDEGALKKYEQVLLTGPDYSQAWYLIGCIHSNRGNKDQAIKNFREAIACANPWPSAYYKLSRAVSDPLEKRVLYEKFVEAQRKLAELERYDQPDPAIANLNDPALLKL